MLGCIHQRHGTGQAVRCTVDQCNVPSHTPALSHTSPIGHDLMLQKPTRHSPVSFIFGDLDLRSTAPGCWSRRPPRQGSNSIETPTSVPLAETFLFVVWLEVCVLYGRAGTSSVHFCATKRGCLWVPNIDFAQDPNTFLFLQHQPDNKKNTQRNE